MRAQRTQDRIRVLTLVDGIGTYGGGESLARLIATGLDRDRFDSTLCVSRWDPASAGDPAVAAALEQMRTAGTDFVGLERGRRTSVRPWLALIRRLRAGRVDVVHAHKFGSNVWGSVVTSVAQTPVFVAHEHTWAFTGDRTRMFADRQLVGRCADAIVAVSREDRRKMIELEGLPADRVVFIPNGIPDPEPGAGGALRAELGIAASAPVLGTVATLRPQKALEVMVDAFAEVVRTHPDAMLVIAGGDDAHHPGLREALIARAERIGVGGSVVFLGLRADVPDVIEGLDVALCSSDFEGSPLSVMEYMEGGKPVVSTSVGGISDLVDDGRTGILVPVRDSGALAAAAVSLIDDPGRARQMGAEGRDRRRTEFSLDSTVTRVEQLYVDLLSRR